MFVRLRPIRELLFTCELDEMFRRPASAMFAATGAQTVQESY